MSEYKRLSRREATERLLALRDPVILIHVHPDADCVGTMAALSRVFAALGQKATYASDDDVPERLAFLLNGTERTRDLRGKDVVSVDVASRKQGGESLLAAEKIDLMIDHHEIGDSFADGYVISGSSSTAEVLYDLIEELVEMGKLTVTREIAEPLFAAMSSDTGGFRFSSAKPRTFRIAASFIELGVNHAEISHKLFYSKSKEQIKAEGFIAKKTELFADGKIAVATHTEAERLELGAAEEHFDTAIEIPRSISGVQIAVIVKETDKGTFKASLRSLGANVAEVAKKFGGGGHIRAAGCSPEAKSIDEAKAMLISELLPLV